MDGDDFVNPTPEEQNIILVSAATLRKAEKMIASCEQCNPAASIAFAVILDLVTGSHQKVTNYILEAPANCPNCRRDVLEKTLVEPSC